MRERRGGADSYDCGHTPARLGICAPIVIIITSIKNNCLKLKNEVGMAVLKSKQTRVVYIEVISAYV